MPSCTFPAFAGDIPEKESAPPLYETRLSPSPVEERDYLHEEYIYKIHRNLFIFDIIKQKRLKYAREIYFYSKQLCYNGARMNTPVSYYAESGVR